MFRSCVLRNGIFRKERSKSAAVFFCFPQNIILYRMRINR